MPHPDWPIKIVAAKYHAVEGAFRILDRALDLSGGRFHPANSALTHEFAAKLTLGISPDEQPRWG